MLRHKISLINNFNSCNLRDDLNNLWTNYLIAERIKWARLKEEKAAFYFWKTYTNQSLELVEVIDNKIRAYKMDWQRKKKVRISKYFTECYPTAKTTIINRSNYWPFLSRRTKK